jgi:CO dehydrogenase/acetyl-CoA synthase delta subunit
VTSPGPRRVGEPRAASVRADASGRPVTIESQTVDAVRETWLVEDRWWTDRPVRRRYWEVVTTGGRNLVVFHELTERRWYRQR